MPHGRLSPVVQVHPSSITPSQSLSTSSHSSGSGCWAVQPSHTPSLHVSWPEPHAVWQALDKLSSVEPLQSLSMPSQISVVGSGAVQPIHCPLEQISVPLPHAV
jgi:hypothetical protein